MIFLDSLTPMIHSNFLAASDRRERLSCMKRKREDHGVTGRLSALLLLDDDTVRGWHKQDLAEGREGGQSRMSAA